MYNDPMPVQNPLQNPADEHRFIARFDVDNEAAQQQSTAERLKAVVRLVLGSSPHQAPLNVERRRDPRVAFPFPIDVIPIDAKGFIRTELQVAVIGRFLSHRGLDFYHLQPLPFPSYRCVLPCHGQGIAVSLQVNWSRCNEHGWMESGGRFLDVDDA